MKKLIITFSSIVLLFGTISCSEHQSEERIKPTQLISAEMASDLEKNYKKYRSTLIDSTYNMEDANAIWYSIDELENYIAYVRTQTKEKGVTMDGIRFYMGVYPSSNKEKAGMTTIFMVPTQAANDINTGGMNYSFQGDSRDITGIEYLNYGTSGLPPYINFPH